MVTYAQLIRRFIDWETREGLFEYRVRNRIVWDYLRYAVFEYFILKQVVRQDEIKPPTASRSKATLGYLRDVFGIVKSCIQFFLESDQKNYDLIVINYDRKNQIDGKIANIHFYPFIQALKDRYRILLVDPSRYEEKVEEVYPCDVFRSRFFHYRAVLRAKFISYVQEEKDIFEKIRQLIQKEFWIDLKLSEIVSQFFSYQLALAEDYQKLFRRVRPRLIVHSDTGSSKGWIEAAHKEGIPVMDYQHSLMSSVNILYHYPKDIGRYHLKTLSDSIFTFGEYWHGEYRLPIRKIAVGFPFTEMKRSELRAGIEKTGGILIISSLHSGKKLEKLALDLSSLLPDQKIFYKLRPEEYVHWQNIYSQELATRENITVIDSDFVPLYEYFSMCNFQIGVNSTALVEGLTFQLTTFILKDGWYEEMQSLIDQGLVFAVETAEDVAAKIRGGELPRRISADQFFKKGSIKNIRQEMENYS